MKNLILVSLFSFSVLGQSFAASVCSRLQQKANDNCVEMLCEDEMQEHGTDECDTDGDFYVAVQECAYEELQLLVAKYNKKNPSKKVNCEY